MTLLPYLACRVALACAVSLGCLLVVVRAVEVLR